MTFLWIGLGIIGLIFLWGIGSKIYISTLEQPKYTVIIKNKGYEIRKYEPWIEASITMKNEENNLNNGFMSVAGYIFGGNESPSGAQNISMTSPVLDTIIKKDETRTVAFVLPSKWTQEDLPTPSNPKVKIEKKEEKIVAATQYFEFFRGQEKDAAYEKLLSHLEKDNISIAGDPTFASYDPPSTPFFFRKNEIHIPIIYTENEGI
jgi:hypothetical protein